MVEKQPKTDKVAKPQDAPAPDVIEKRGGQTAPPNAAPAPAISKQLPEPPPRPSSPPAEDGK
jgi:hypothetical protein